MMIDHPSAVLHTPSFVTASSLVRNVDQTKEVTNKALDKTISIELNDDELLAMAEMFETKHKE